MNASFYRVCSSFSSLTPFFLPDRPVSALSALIVDQILYLSQSISVRFDKSKPGSRTILATIDFSKAFDSVWHSALFHKLFSLAYLLALLVGLNLSFLIGALAWFFKTPLRPILYMTGSSDHELGKWLASLLQSVLECFSSHCISDSFTFAKAIQNLVIDSNVFMCSFDVSSLFTNVPLMKPSKSVQEPSVTTLIPNQSFQKTCLLNS